MINDSIIVLTASPQDSGQRIDKLLSLSDEGLSRSTAARLISQGRVFVNGKQVQKSCIISEGDVIEAFLPEPAALDIKAENIPLEIIYEDSSLLVVNKPKGMVVHPAAGHYSGTLVNALMYHCGDRLSSINGVIRPGIVHRIDKNTSGLLMVAKTDSAHRSLAAQIKAHSFEREYSAVVCGRMSEGDGTVNAPIGRHPAQRKKMAVTERASRYAVTHYTVIEQFDRYSLLRLRLETGRTHQIRVHMAYIGHPVLGDDVYGKPFAGLEGQCLHAGKIGFVHPVTNEYMEFESELPQYFCEVLEKLRRTQR